MTAHDIDIELPPLPPLYIVPSVEPVDYPEVAQALIDYARAAVEPYAKRIAQLEAAHFAYASEFPPNEDGDPDVGSIHENIRKLKAELEADRKRRGEQRIIGKIVLDGNRHPRAVLATGYDEHGDQWKEGTPIYAAPQPAERSRGEPVAYPVRVGCEEGRLAKRPYQTGDNLPAVGSYCLISGANCDIESDQHRGYSWRQVLGYSDDNKFICLQTSGCWPTVERTTNCWFADIPHPMGGDPQPAEPVNVDHGETRVNIGLEEKTGNDLGGVVDHVKAEPVNKTDWNAELSSWSDEDFIHIFYERPDLADRLRNMLADPVKVPSDDLQGLSDHAYCQYIEQMRRPECLGWEQKVKDGRFGEAELKAHTKAGEFLGRHHALSEAAALLAHYGKTQPAYGKIVDESTRKWKRIEEYSREMDGKKIDIYLGDFLLYCPELEDEENNGVVIGYYSEPYRGWYTSETLEEVFPTHFMPLPEKPL